MTDIKELLAAVTNVCEKHRVSTVCVASLMRWRDTEDGQRFMAGLPLSPQFPRDNRTRGWARSPRKRRDRDDVWGLEDEW